LPCFIPMNIWIYTFIIIFALQMLCYYWAYKKQSDHLTDFSYSATFIIITLGFLYLLGPLSFSRVALSLMVILWGLRLGSFLFYRIHKMGKDSRFDSFRSSQTGFLKFWTLQAVSIFIIILPTLYGLTNTNLKINFLAMMLWLLGFIIQAMSDHQKFVFKMKTKDKDFISSGCYKYLRHPNYLGEIMMWWAILLYVSPLLSGIQWFLILCPLWITILIIFISGIPLIEVTYPIKYKNNPNHDAYLNRTWRLLPWIY
jgi:steroid 5-alpha reductase family enzyme